jgi:sarcosine oxidase subunit gamma
MGYDALVDQLPLRCLVDVRGAPQAVRALLERACLAPPVAPMTWEENDKANVAHVGPRRWLVIATIEGEAALLASLPGAVDGASAVVVSDAFTGFSIIGPQAGEVVAQGCPLDIHPASFPGTGATATVLFGQTALLLRRADGFECFVDASAADYVADRFSRCRARLGPWFERYQAGRA